MEPLILLISDFSIVPGPRYKDEGGYSGEEFRESILEPKYREAIKSNSKLLVNLDGTAGFGTSWLEEVFGGLARNFDKQEVLKTIEFISIEEPYLIQDIEGYLIDA